MRHILSQKLVSLANLTQAIVKFQEATQQFFTYYTVNDSEVCSKCDNYDEGSMTRREIEGTFPYLIKYTFEMWVPMVHPNCRCVLLLEETDLPRKDALSTQKLILKVENEVITKYTQKMVVAPDPAASRVLEKFKDLPQDLQIKVIRDEIEQRTHGLLPNELDEDDDDLWDLIALGILDTLKRRQQREEEK
jgi:hypothetical protein